MFINKTILCLVSILSVLTIAQCRKYDIEQESYTLYGESLRSVVDRFRRTPEYLTILKGEFTEHLKKLNAVIDRITYVFALKLHDRVVQELGANQTTLRTRPEQFLPRMGKPFPRPPMSRRGPKKSVVNLLDTYDSFKSPLTLAEKNRMKEIGFEYAGLAIHAMLAHISPDDTLPISTLLPYGGHHTDKSTTHHHHEFTQPSTEPEASPTHEHHQSTHIGRTRLTE